MNADISDMIVRAEDAAEMGRLPFAERARVRAWETCLAMFEAAPDIETGFASTRAAYPQLCVNRSKLYRNLRAYKAEGWRGLVNKTILRALQKQDALPAPFVEYWQALCCSNQRKIAPAYRSLIMDHLCAGKRIPGYGDWRQIWTIQHPGWTCPDGCPYRPEDCVPDGWTYRNLLRYAPTEFELAATRIGTGEATKYLPKVPTTRAGLKLGQYYVIDDVWHDVKVNFVGNRKAYLPLELGALELLSGHYCVWGLKPILERADGTRDMLPERYVRYLLAHILCRIGIHPAGCTFLGEHGTARIPAELVAAINRWAGGAVSFEAGGIHGAPITRGLFDGRPRGNSRFKSALEAHHNLKHNELAALPGQKGMDRDHAPEEQYGRDKENLALIKAAWALADERPDLAAELRLPYATFSQFRDALGVVYDRIANRIHHHLEGFEDSGLTVQEFRLANGLPWMPIAEMATYDEQQRAAIMAVISRPGFIKARAMSPAEAFRAKSAELVRLPDCALPDILGPQLGAEVAVSSDLMLTVPDADTPTRQHQFVAVVSDIHGRECPLSRGAHYLVHVSPFGDDLAYVSDPRGEFLGTARAMQRACRTDMDALHRNLGMQRQVMSAELKRLAPVAERRLRDRFEDVAANVHVLTSAAVPAMVARQAEAEAAVIAAGEARAERRRIAVNAGNAADFMADDSDPRTPVDLDDFRNML